jgi:hypothetical protein
MNESSSNTCSTCGQTHEEWPALAFISPDNYDMLSEEDKQNIGELNSDFCVINHPEQIDRFIRTTLFQKVVDHCEELNYGLWVSLSEKSFSDYNENFNNEDHEVQYFGWLSNDIPGYDFEESIPMTVYTSKGNSRPVIIPHSDFDHPFVKDYYNGISKQEAEKRIQDMKNKVTPSL